MSREVVVLGAGGHAHVVIDVLLDRDVVVACMIGTRAAEPYRDVEVIVGDENLAELAKRYDACVIAVGDNQMRQELAELAQQSGFALATVVARSARVSPTAELGPGCVVMEGAIINAGARLGALCLVNTSASVDHDCELGVAVHVAPGARLTGRVRVGDASLIGAGAVVVPGIEIGAASIIGAGSVVAETVPDGVTVVGVPARALEHAK